MNSMRGLKRLEGKRAKIPPRPRNFKPGGACEEIMSLDQVQAVRDAGGCGFAMWNARNVHTDGPRRAAKGA